MLKSISWALYLSTSWTWCIGMWAPTIAFKWLGWTGFLVFLIPNVLGTVSFGLLIKSKDISKSFVDKHRIAVILFSTGVLFFHFYWVTWIFTSKQSNIFEAWDWSIPFWLASFAILGTYLPNWGWRLFAFLTFLTSIYVGKFYLPFDLKSWPLMSGTKEPMQIIWITLFSFLGFFGSPWLDPTFHKARQEGGKLPFLIFPIFFIPSILLTALYSKIGFSEIIIWPFLIHIIIQTLFTTSAHYSELETLLKNKKNLSDLIIISTPITATLLSYIAFKFNIGEIIYLDLLGLYGVIFPMYIFTYASQRLSTRKKLLYSFFWILISGIISAIALRHDQIFFLLGMPPLIAIIYLLREKKELFSTLFKRTL